MRRMGRSAVVALLLALIVVAGGIVGGLVILNSPQRVGQAWAEALSKKDEAALQKLVLPKDKERVPKLLSAAKMLPDMQVQFVGIDERDGQKVARVSIQFSRVTVGSYTLNLKGSAELPFILARDRWIFWRVDLEQSDPLVQEAAKQAIWKAIQQDPRIQQLLKLFGIH